MYSIYQVTTEEDRARIRELFWAYLEWANGRVNEEYGVNFDTKTMLENERRKVENGGAILR